MARLHSFEELGCWKAGRSFKQFVFSLLKFFPADERFTLVPQVKNAARSITHNIAEGFGRQLAFDNAKFCRIARGSLFEVLDQMNTANDEGIITDDQLLQVREHFQNALSPLDGYIDYLVRQRVANELREPDGEYGIDKVEGSVFQHYNSPTASTNN